jgi:hypothetical protein
MKRGTKGRIVRIKQREIAALRKRKSKSSPEISDASRVTTSGAVVRRG